MSIEFRPYEYQRTAIDWILDHPRCGLFLDMGLGKTICTLSAIDELIYERLEIRKVLVIAPLRVASSVWAQEAAKWEQTRGLTVSRVLGSAVQRRKALRQPADIYVVNRENICWLMKAQDFNFDMVVIDELSSFKSPSARRFRSLRRVIKNARRVVGLTGTPAPNGLMDLWAEMYLIDNGERLGRTITGYRETYFRPGWGNGYVVYSYTPLAGSEAAIKAKIADVCISMKKEDYLDMPDRVFQDVEVELPAPAMAQYAAMERDFLLQIGDDEITALNAGAVNVKLQQMANGQIYKEDGSFAELHDAKLEALEQLVEEANGSPVLVFTAFRADVERIRSRLGKAVHGLDTEKDIAAWNRGEFPVVVAHPASIGHGLNLQQGGHIIIWYGLTWSLELYQQANDRLYRQGQKNTVSVYHLAAKGTVDEACLAALTKKSDTQAALMDYLKARREELKEEKTA